VIEGGVALRPRDTGGVVDLGVALLRAEWKRVARGSLPMLAAAFLCALVAWREDAWLGLGVAWILGRAAHVPVTRALGERASGAPAAGGLLGDLGRGLGVTLLVVLGYAAASCFFPIVFWVAWRSVFLPEVAILERPSSGLLARGSSVSEAPGAHPLGVVTWLWAADLFGLVAGELSGRAVVGDLLMVTDLFANPDAFEPSVYGLVGVLAVQPFRAAVRFAGYLDARTRAEALDVFFALRAAASDGVRR